MVSPKSQCKMIVDSTDATNEDKLKILDDVINTSTCVEDLIHYHAKRSLVHFNMERWLDALSDIDFVEQHNCMNDKLFLLKWKSTVHVDIGKVRDSAKNTIHMRMLDDKDYTDFLNAISTENVGDLLANNRVQSRSSKKLKK